MSQKKSVDINIPYVCEVVGIHSFKFDSVLFSMNSHHKLSRDT